MVLSGSLVMGESSAIKLHHAFKAPRDTREPDHPCCIAHDQDLDAAKKPIIAVSQGAKLVYEYKDGASLVKPATALAGYNVKKMVRRLNATKKFWSTNGRAKARVNAFRNLDMSAEPKIRQVICTGIGSFSSYDTKDLVCNSYNQLTELLLFLEILKNKSLVKENFKIYFQDPAFNKLDIAFLEPFGYRVIHNPEAFNLMTEDTLLYAPGNHDDITYHAIRVARPCLFIGNDLTIWGEVNGLPNPDETTYKAL